MTPAHLTTVAIRTALVENPPGKVPVSSGLVMIERGTQPNGDRIPGDTHFSRKGVSLWASRPSEGECAEAKTKDRKIERFAGGKTRDHPRTQNRKQAGALDSEP